jgi:serine/threonine protein kinase
MGFVYRATDLSLNRDVAIKILPPHYNDDEAIVGRFQREARAMASLDHPNIVTVYSIGQDRGVHYFVMKLLRGQTLAHLLKSIKDGLSEPLSASQSIDLLIQASNGLEHAHSKSLLHRDIKPGNLMVSPEGSLTIMDFGIVKRLDDSESVGLKTAHGKIFGTPEYMPPEQAMGKGDYSPASDLYALTVVGYELLCGQLPYVADTPIGIIIQHIRSEVPTLTGRAEGQFPILERIFSRALAKEPRERFESAAEFRNALSYALQNIAKPQLSPVLPNPIGQTPAESITREDSQFEDIDLPPPHAPEFDLGGALFEAASSDHQELIHSSEAPETVPPISVQGRPQRPMNSPDVTARHQPDQPPPSAQVPPPPVKPRSEPETLEFRSTQVLTPASKRSGHYVNPLKRRK